MVVGKLWLIEFVPKSRASREALSAIISKIFTTCYINIASTINFGSYHTASVDPEHGIRYAIDGKFKVDLRPTNDDRRYFYHPHNLNLSSNVIYFDSNLEAVLMKVFKYPR